MTPTRFLRALIAIFALLCVVPVAADTLPVGDAPHLAMRLVAESANPRAGGVVTIALETVPEKGWHGYWSNPGDAGFPAKFDWTLPKGATAAPPRWPVPGTLLVAGLMNHVYERPYALLFDIALPRGLAAGSAVPVTLHANYLVCTDTICVPEEQTLALALNIGDGAADASVTAKFAAWRRAIPRALDARATWAASAAAGKDGLRIAIPYPADAALSDVHFFTETPGAVDYAAKQTVAREGDRLVLTTTGKPSGTFEGVLRIGADRGLAIRAVPGAIGAAARDDWVGTALLAFAGAVLGGLILNVMPCVFPILSLKALSLAKSGADARAARGEALAYSAGVILVCVGLGAGLLALRAAGSSVGWAFQLQDPRVIGVLLLLVVAIALNLAGLFELPTPQFAGRSGAGGAFATGALAAFVATPCTGPFMAGALGAALLLPGPAALMIFAGLGLGIALPFLLIGFVPALRRRLPRPGAWMGRLRRILSVPMFLTALALAWVLGQEAQVAGMTIGLAAVLLASLGLWWTGRRQLAGLNPWLPGGVALIAACALVLAVRPAPAGAAVAAQGEERFSEARLAALRAGGKPVFAYFTADWCLTCKVNERTSIDTDAVRDAFAGQGVAVLVGDWTDGDPVLGRFIEANNRAGVPLYLYYPRGGGAPRVLPQVLTPGMLTGLGA
ncbi:protein-disulfide reductase DsbD family protein [Sphingomonas sp.]|uniref:protein-disulfide reductase DsbD family protein n=1 Tax=Sphingomonas sp. TaxID=28214 RepID=UPI002EDAD649